MRALVAGLLSLLLAAPLATPAAAQDSSDDDNSVESVMAAVVPYASTLGSVSEDIAALTSYREQVQAAQQTYLSWSRALTPVLRDLNDKVDGLTQRLAELQAQERTLVRRLNALRVQQTAQQRQVGAIARLLYQQPSPDLTAVAQLIDGEDLRAFDRQDLVMDVLESATAKLDRIKGRVARVNSDLDQTRSDIRSTTRDLKETTEHRDAVAAKEAVVQSSLRAIAYDLSVAGGKIDAIRRAEEARLRRAAAAAALAEKAAAAAARSRSTAAPARPTGGGVAAHDSGEFSALLPAETPYRQVFITYGLRYRVEPALIAAIASQESNFNAWAGCDGGGGKGIMQHENQASYCGPDAVPASVEKAAQMLAAYYNASGSWSAAVFAFNNGPGLMDEWVANSGNRDRLLSVLAAFYDQQSYATPGPKDGYASWGQWRARVAYSYAAPDPLPGFRSATQKWLIYRQG